MYEKLILIGNLGGDPEMRYMPSGTAVTNFSMATNRHWTTKDGEKKTQTVWYKVAVWGPAAEACNQYLTRGQRVMVEGQLNPDENGNPRVWQTKDGQPAASYEVTASVVKFLGASGQDQGHEETVVKDEDPIPF